MFGYDLKQASTYYFKQYGVINFILLFLIFIAIPFGIFLFIATIIKNIYLGMTICFIFFLIFMGYLSVVVNHRIHKPNEKNNIRLKKVLSAAWNIAPAILMYTLIFGIILTLTICVMIIAEPDTIFSLVSLGIVMPDRMIKVVRIFNAVYIIMQIIFAPLIIAQYLSFCLNLKCKSAFSLKAIKFILIKNSKLFFLLLLLLCLLWISGILAVSIPFLGLIICFFSWFVDADLLAQFIRKIFKIGQVGEVNG